MYHTRVQRCNKICQPKEYLYYSIGSKQKKNKKKNKKKQKKKNTYRPPFSPGAVNFF